MPWDPLAHLRVTTTAMGEAARLVDRVAHGHAGGRWLATGGGGYDAYRVVPRSWSLVWLAGAHREVPDATPVEWRERWAAEAARYGQAPLPATFEDAPNAGIEMDASQAMAEARGLETVGVVRRLVVPRLLQVARDRGWWDPLASVSDAGSGGVRADTRRRTAADHPSRRRDVGAAQPGAACRGPVTTQLRATPSSVRPSPTARASSAAVEGTTVVGLAIAGPTDDAWPPRPSRAWRGTVFPAAGSRRRPSSRHASPPATPGATEYTADVTLAERDPIEPLDRALRADIARRLLEGAGFRIQSADPALRGRRPRMLCARVRPAT